MGYWSVYVSKEDEKILKKKLEQVAQKMHWSFSQAVAGVLREHLVEEGERMSDEELWKRLSTKSFFNRYSEKDSIYDKINALVLKRIGKLSSPERRKVRTILKKIFEL